MSEEKNIEVEVRALFSKEKYLELKSFLDKNAKDLGQDDKDAYIFLLYTKVVKVVNNISKKTAKIVIKLTRVGTGGNDTEEIEIPISPVDFEKSVKLFKELSFDQVQRAYQVRRNYMYKDIELALKFSSAWGYHIELEIMISDKKDQKLAEKRLTDLAAELDVNILTKKEQAEFVSKIDSNYQSRK